MPNSSDLQRARAELSRQLRESGPILIGLSGGGDSMALMHLIGDVAPARTKVACIVDHALRSASADEARWTAQRAAALGFTPQVIRLRWGRDQVGQARAREARYHAMAAVAAEIGADRIHLGHTADDQAETVLLRLGAGSNRRGLAAMSPLSPCPIWPVGRTLWLSRPLLSVRRAALRTFLEEKGAAWLEDPSNQMTRFARVRLRARLQERDVARALRVAERCADRAGVIDAAARTLLKAAELDAGTARVPVGVLQSVSKTILLRAAAALITAIAGATREPTAQRVERAWAALSAHAPAVTVSGAIWRRRGAHFYFSRDPGGVRGRRDGAPGVEPLDLAPGQSAVWDGRLLLTAHRALRASAPSRPDKDLAPTLCLPCGARYNLIEAVHDGWVAACWLIPARLERLLWRGSVNRRLTAGEQ